MDFIKSIQTGFALGFFSVVIKIIIPYAIRFFNVLTHVDKKLRDFNWRLNINWKDEIIFGLAFGTLFFLVFYFGSSANNTSGVNNFLVPVLFLVLLNSYNFLIRPLIRLFTGDKYVANKEWEKWITDRFGKAVRLRTINDTVINAYAVGVLPFTKTILLGNLLIDKMDRKDTESIVLHELGHIEENHLFILFIAAIINSILFVLAFFYMWVYILPLVHIFGGKGVIVALTAGLLGGFQFLTMALVQRMLEYRADRYAASKTGAKAYIRALRALDKIANGKLKKDSIHHPALEKRVANVNKHCK